MIMCLKTVVDVYVLHHVQCSPQFVFITGVYVAARHGGCTTTGHGRTRDERLNTVY